MLLSLFRWGENKRASDPGYFCRLVCQEAIALEKPIWIISDARRLTDVEYFQVTCRLCWESYGSTCVCVKSERLFPGTATVIQEQNCFAPEK